MGFGYLCVNWTSLSSFLPYDASECSKTKASARHSRVRNKIYSYSFIVNIFLTVYSLFQSNNLDWNTVFLRKCRSIAREWKIKSWIWFFSWRQSARPFSKTWWLWTLTPVWMVLSSTRSPPGTELESATMTESAEIESRPPMDTVISASICLIKAKLLLTVPSTSRGRSDTSSLFWPRWVLCYFFFFLNIASNWRTYYHYWYDRTKVVCINKVLFHERVIKKKYEPSYEKSVIL